MDREDSIYLVAVALVSVGAGLFHPGAGLVCAGVGIGFPFFLKLLRGTPKDET